MNTKQGNRRQGPWETVRRAFAEFLKLPTSIVAGFLALAVVTTWIDHADVSWLRTLRAATHDDSFRDSQATSDLPSTIASSVIALTSIAFSPLLLAVQQAAAALSGVVHALDAAGRHETAARVRVAQGSLAAFVGKLGSRATRCVQRKVAPG